jgi:hypothetical protein
MPVAAFGRRGSFRIPTGCIRNGTIPPMRRGCRGPSPGRVPASSSHPMEATMSKVITFDKGSKRRMKQIRWKLREVISAVLVSLVVLGLGVLFALWEVSHYEPYSDEPKAPHVEAPR